MSAYVSSGKAGIGSACLPYSTASSRADVPLPTPKDFSKYGHGAVKKSSHESHLKKSFIPHVAH
jgi:hypothetical protein